MKIENKTKTDVQSNLEMVIKISEIRPKRRGRLCWKDLWKR